MNKQAEMMVSYKKAWLNGSKNCAPFGGKNIIKKQFQLKL